MRVAMFPRRSGPKDNPYLAILTGALAQQGVRLRPIWWPILPDALHLHWLESPLWGRFVQRLPLLAEMRVALILLLARVLHALDRPVIWTAHNLAPHDFASARHARLYARMRASFLPSVSDVICMGQSAEAAVRAAFPELARARFHLIAHPHYRGHFDPIAPQIPPEVAADLQGETPPVIITFGHVRAYKGLPALIGQLRATSLAFRLIIAGKGPRTEREAITAAIGGDGRFCCIPRRISDAELAGLTGRAALVLFNFQTILNSGSVLASLSLGRPVLAPALGAMPELHRRLGDWVHLFQGPLTAEAITEALAHPPQTPIDLAPFDPDAIARAHRALYAQSLLPQTVPEWS